MRTARSEPFAVVTVIGEVDATTTGRLRDALRAAGGPDVLLDLSQMTFMDSAGIRVLLDAYKQARERGGSIAVCGLLPSPRKVLELVGLAEHIPAYATVAEAIAAGPQRSNATP
ncbi:STAS domain-containing protein [Streptosporangiaceae bacterium NEAU-GS5]|nr:STAS domain-containing protein [Streptosporangiaceae bacterium NEAU-GS5]